MSKLEKVTKEVLKSLWDLGYLKSHKLVSDFLKNIDNINEESAKKIEFGFSKWVVDLENTKEQLLNGTGYITTDNDYFEFLTNVINQ